jgi:xanthine dehydrogenase YagS FAD-binding subunit
VKEAAFMRSFEHFNARTIKEACGLLKKYGNRARISAGGTDLIAVLKDEILLKYPEAIIDIKTIPDLDYIREDRGGLRIGALSKLSDIAKSPVVRGKYTVLAEAAHAVATPQIRNMGTIGGNLCQDVRCWYYRYPSRIGGPIRCLRKGSGPCLAVTGDNRYHAILGGKRCFAVCPSDTAIALTALDATVSIAGTGATRRIRVQDFFTSLGTVLCPGEIVTEIRIPKTPEGARQTFLKFTSRKPVDFAIVSVASVVLVDNGICTDVRIALGAVAPTPVRATAAEEVLKGEPINETAATEAAEIAVADANPLSMNAYKVEITKALVKKTLFM